MSPPEKKKRKRLHEKKPSLVLAQTSQFLSLPDELVVSCLARISKSFYPTLSLISKSFRSLLSLPELYETRSLLNRTESFLYVCLEYPRDPNPHWFTLCRKPNRTLANDTMKKKTGNILVPISSPPCPHGVGLSSSVVVGSDIYKIGGFDNGEALSSVSVLDCRSHTWHDAPNMCEKMNYPSANVIDGKIYVVGGKGQKFIANRSFADWNIANWIEVFDPKTQTWKSFSIPCAKINGNTIVETLVIDGKIYMYGSKGASYNPKEGTCESVKGIKNMFDARKNSRCVINNVLLCYHYDEVFKWYDTRVRKWRKLKGLKELPEFPSDSDVNLGDYGGNMVVFWDEYVHTGVYDHGYQRRKWCAEIALERCTNEDIIWGKVLWFDAVLDVPICCDIVNIFAATV